MIETKVFQLAKNKYTGIAMRKYFESRTWSFVLYFIVCIFYFNFKDLFKYDDFWGYILIGFPIVNTAYVFYLVRFNLSQRLVGETSLTFDTEYMYFKKNKIRG